MKKKVSLVLSGGGARGIAHIGVIEELERQGFEIQSIAGTSMGALVGGIYGSGKMQAYKEWIYKLNKYEVFKLIDFSLSKQGFIKGDRVFNKMKEFIPDMNIEDLKIHYTATATDILNKNEVVFTKGSIYDAIRASIAIPSVVTPVKTENSLLVDGGVVNNIPINHVKRIKDDILVVVNVNANVPLYEPKITSKEKAQRKSIYSKKMNEFQGHLDKYFPKEKNNNLGYITILNTTIEMLINQLAMVTIEKTPPDILINISHSSCSAFDFYKAEELVEIGRDVAAQSIANYKESLKQMKV